MYNTIQNTLLDQTVVDVRVKSNTRGLIHNIYATAVDTETRPEITGRSFVGVCFVSNVNVR